MKNKRKWSKGEMSRTIVVYCIRVLFGTLVWAISLKTLGAALGWTVDLSDVLTFAGGAFGGELLLLAFKRIFTKKNEDLEV
jgi:hypothetical protein